MILKKLLDKKFIPIYVCIAALIFVFIMVTSAGKSTKPLTAQDTAFASRKTITVGVVTQNNTFAFEDEEGNITGYDVDVITELLKRAYPDKKVVLKAIDSQIASYMLKTGEINLAIGQYTKGVTKTQGLALTAGYYEDPVCAYVLKESSLRDINELRSKKIFVMTTEISRSAVKTALDQLVTDTQIISCSSYSDAKESLMGGGSGAIIAPKQLMELRRIELRSLPTEVSTASYCILAWTDNTNVTSYLNTYIAEMKADGTLAEFEKKYGIYIPPREEAQE